MLDAPSGAPPLLRKHLNLKIFAHLIGPHALGLGLAPGVRGRPQITRPRRNANLRSHSTGEGRLDLAVFREATERFLREQQVAVESDLENTALALFEHALDAKFFLDRCRQTGGARLVVSNHAVLNRQRLHAESPVLINRVREGSPFGHTRWVQSNRGRPTNTIVTDGVGSWCRQGESPRRVQCPGFSTRRAGQGIP